MKVLGLGQHLRFHSHTMCNRVCNNNVIGYVKWCEMLNHLTWTQFHSNFISLLMETYQSLWSGCWDFKHAFKMNTYFWQEFWILNALVTLLYLTCNYKHTWPCSENVNLSSKRGYTTGYVADMLIRGPSVWCHFLWHGPLTQMNKMAPQMFVSSLDNSGNTSHTLNSPNY